MKKRGFEKISMQQFKKEMANYCDIKTNYNDIILPKRGTKNSAGYDMFSPFSFVLKPNEKIILPTFIKAYRL